MCLHVIKSCSHKVGTQSAAFHFIKLCPRSYFYSDEVDLIYLFVLPKAVSSTSTLVRS